MEEKIKRDNAEREKIIVDDSNRATVSDEDLLEDLGNVLRQRGTGKLLILSISNCLSLHRKKLNKIFFDPVDDNLGFVDRAKAGEFIGLKSRCFFINGNETFVASIDRYVQTAQNRLCYLLRLNHLILS